MKLALICFLITFSTFLCAEQNSGNSTDLPFSSNTIIAPLLPLKQEPIVTINADNRKKYIYNPELNQQQSNQVKEALHSKAIPWQGLLAAAAVIIAIILVKMSPQPIRAKKTGMNPEELQRAAIKELLETEQSHLPQKKMYGEYFSHLDHAVRTYLQGKYDINASAYTTQELLHNLQHYPAMDNDARLQLIRFLKSAEQVKYAKYSPTPQECSLALEEVRKLIPNKTDNGPHGPH